MLIVMRLANMHRVHQGRQLPRMRQVRPSGRHLSVRAGSAAPPAGSDDYLRCVLQGGHCRHDVRAARSGAGVGGKRGCRKAGSQTLKWSTPRPRKLLTSWCVCACPIRQASPTTSTSACTQCGAGIYFRPYAPRRVRRVCTRCALTLIWRPRGGPDLNRHYTTEVGPCLLDYSSRGQTLSYGKNQRPDTERHPVHRSLASWHEQRHVQPVRAAGAGRRCAADDMEQGRQGHADLLRALHRHRPALAGQSCGCISSRFPCRTAEKW